MLRNILTIGAVSAAVMLSSTAEAALIPGAPVVVPFDNAQVTVEYWNAWAGWTGELYFLGSGTESEVLVSAPDDGAGLGQFLMDNRGAPSAGPITLTGIFNQGDVLHFAYLIVDPEPFVGRLYRTDVASDAIQFAWNADNGDFTVEDNIPGDPWNDYDYNDMIVNIQFTQIPTPGTAALALMAVFVAAQRRRRPGAADVS